MLWSTPILESLSRQFLADCLTPPRITWASKCSGIAKLSPGILLIEQVSEINFQSLRNSKNELEGWVSLAAFELAQVGVIYVSFDGKLFLRPTLDLAALTNAFSDVSYELIFWLHASKCVLGKVFSPRDLSLAWRLKVSLYGVWKVYNFTSQEGLAVNLQNKEESQKYAVEACLAAARQLADEGKAEQAEQVYKKALTTAEGKAGKNSALAGLVLIDMVHFYEKQGRHEEAEPLWKRVRTVMLEYLPMILGGNGTPK